MKIKTFLLKQINIYNNKDVYIKIKTFLLK